MSSRLVKFVMNNGIQRCINMRNVLAVEREGVKVTIEYNICDPDGMGSRCYKEDLTFKSVKAAEAMYESLTAELS
jgi:hypothetical protein